MSDKPKVLFLCTGNSCRSQMAEAWTRHLKGDRYEPYSAGVDVRPVDPLAVRAMAEVGLDISGQHSKHVDSLKDLEFDYVITVCDHAREACPFFPARTSLLHQEFADPPKLAQTARNEGEALDYYRRVRDEIKAFIESLQEILEKDGQTP
jgi:arsenate reductase (thioredoxin)